MPSEQTLKTNKNGRSLSYKKLSDGLSKTSETAESHQTKVQLRFTALHCDRSEGSKNNHYRLTANVDFQGKSVVIKSTPGTHTFMGIV